MVRNFLTQPVEPDPTQPDQRIFEWTRPDPTWPKPKAVL